MLKKTKKVLFLDIFNANLKFGGTLKKFHGTLVRRTPVEKHCVRVFLGLLNETEQ
jgi:hypothetical protein